jgi:hypothetical protein
VEVTARKTSQDFANCMTQLVDDLFPSAEKIYLVLDNYCTHQLKTLYDYFPASEARRIIKRLEVHYTPKHGSWLNQAEIEIGVLSHQCLKIRTGGVEELKAEIAAWEVQRNQEKATINWQFTVEKARVKMGKSYPSKLS